MFADEGAQECLRGMSNWGRWGPDDERGTLNFITPEKVMAAIATVRTGRTVSIGFDLDDRPSQKNPTPPVHVMRYRAQQAHSAHDQITVTPHGFSVTHLDAIGHCYHDEKLYNGRPVDENVGVRGLSFGSIYAQRDGIVTRGILLDVAAARDREYLDPGDYVKIDDLKSAERYGNVRTQRGDAIFVRVGLGARESVEGTEDPALRAGLDLSSIRWVHDSEVAVYSGDCVERLPSQIPSLPLPLHQIGLAQMGLVMLDNPNVETLARACREEQSYEFLFVAAPLRIPGGTGSPVNPVCLF